MTGLAWLRELLTAAPAIVAVVREARRKGDHRPAREIWSEVRSRREREAAIRRTRERLGLPPEDAP